MRSVWLMWFSLLLNVSVVFAHEGENLTPSTLLYYWNTAPVLVVSLIAVAWLYTRGTMNLWRHSGVGHGIKRRQAGCFAAGLVALCLALVSPIDSLAEQLFSVHMIQHMLLVAVAAPLMALSTPLLAMMWAFPHQRRLFGQMGRLPLMRFVASLMAAPLFLWLLHVGTLWLWHIPSLYEAAMASPLVHSIEHLTFFVTAFFFWWYALHNRHLGLAVFALFTVMLASGLLGVLITFASAPWYPTHIGSALLWQLTPLEDQQLAGVIMWIPMGAVYVCAALGRVARLLNDPDVPERRA